jgi:DNA-binding SARP family transcriptional activator
LVKVHLAQGNRFEAARQYNSCRQLLQSELGLEPSYGLQELLPKEMRQGPIQRAARIGCHELHLRPQLLDCD